MTLPTWALERAREILANNGLIHDAPYNEGLQLSIGRALREARAMGPEWRPIETAKKDGSWMLLAKIVGHPAHPMSLWWVCCGHWSARWNNWNDGIEPSGLSDPTHYLFADGHGVR